jgi:endo-1,4-beta-xylanase
MSAFVSTSSAPSGNPASDKGELAKLCRQLPFVSPFCGPRYLGAAVAMSPLKSEQLYRETLAFEFSAATAENCMKWGSLNVSEGKWNFEEADRFVAFCETNKLVIKGHALVWHNQLPAFLHHKMNKETLFFFMKLHILKVVQRYKGKVKRWDVLNEVVDDSGVGLRKTIFSKILGDEFIEKAFKWAHEADPDALLYYNDYSICDWNKKSTFTYSMVKRLLAKSIPIHGVGFQCHLHANSINFEGIKRNILRFSALGLFVNFSEVDVRVSGISDCLQTRLNFQKIALRRLMATAFSCPKFEGLTFWGFTDLHSWVHGFFGKDEPLVFDCEYRKKPSFDGCRVGLLSIPLKINESSLKRRFVCQVEDCFAFEGCKIDGSAQVSYAKKNGFVCFALNPPLPGSELCNIKCMGINVATEMSGGVVELRANTVDGPVLCVGGIVPTGSYSSFQMQYFALSNTGSEADLSAIFLTFLDADVGNFTRLEFSEIVL